MKLLVHCSDCGGSYPLPPPRPAGEPRGEPPHTCDTEQVIAHQRHLRRRAEERLAAARRALWTAAAVGVGFAAGWLWCAA